MSFGRLLGIACNTLRLNENNKGFKLEILRMDKQGGVDNFDVNEKLKQHLIIKFTSLLDINNDERTKIVACFTTLNRTNCSC